MSNIYRITITILEILFISTSIYKVFTYLAICLFYYLTNNILGY